MKAIIGIGIPGSGKTTYLKPLAQREGLVYINVDEIRHSINGNPADQSNHQKVMRIFHDRVVEALAHSGVVIDMTYSRQRDRRQAVLFCRQHGAEEVIAYWFNTPLSIAQRRNNLRDRNVPDRVLAIMSTRLQIMPPSLDEGFDKIIVIEN